MGRPINLIRVSLSYATFGIAVDGGKVKDAAPIANWMIGKDTPFIREWINKKGGRFENRGRIGKF